MFVGFPASEFESVLHTKRQKEEVALPEVSLDKDINKEGHMELEDSSKPQVTFLVSCCTFCMAQGHAHVLSLSHDQLEVGRERVP